jgi:hypothetical protein
VLVPLPENLEVVEEGALFFEEFKDNTDSQLHH